jgi:hypothetical protein
MIYFETAFYFAIIADSGEFSSADFKIGAVRENAY